MRKVFVSNLISVDNKIARPNGDLDWFGVDQEYFDYTENYWRAWVNKNAADFHSLAPSVAEMYKRSLLIVQTQIDSGGAILAANDSDVAERATDHYSYLWTRDGAFVANALDLAGYPHITRKFFDLCGRIVHPEGYFLQKYNADGTVASGWHASWDPYSKTALIPIQEDETALVLWALWEHYEQFRDIEFAQRLYRNMVTRCADFMVEFRDPDTHLPRPSWNLWEDRRGVHTFTCSTVVGGLRAAARFADLFAEHERAAIYGQAATEMVEAMSEHLYSPKLGRFLRSLSTAHDGSLAPDDTVDASLFGAFYFGCYPPDDNKVAGTMAAIKERLGSGGGIARFENDAYMRSADSHAGNIWFICTLWLADYYIAAAKSVGELTPALEILEWVAASALPSGVLAEQLNPETGEHVSVSPLTWSHSTFIACIQAYLRKEKTFIDRRK